MMIQNKELAKYIQIWFTENKDKLPLNEFWNNNAVGKMMKDNLNKIKRWKRRPRGKPNKNINKLKSAEKIEIKEIKEEKDQIDKLSGENATDW